MNAKQKKRLISLSLILMLLTAAAGLILYALKQNINLFYTPTQLAELTIAPSRAIRIGGYVKENSVTYLNNGEEIHFIVTDKKNEMSVTYHGILPNLFREGQTVVVTGKLQNNIINASQVLAKHDEKYIPQYLVKELKRS